MRGNRMLILVFVEFAIAIAFAVLSALVFIYRLDDLWILALLAVGGIAGLLNGVYLLKQRNKPRQRKRTAKPKRQ